MQEFEKIVDAKDDKKRFREDIITQIGVHSLEKSDLKEKADYTIIFNDLMKKIKDHYYDEQKSLITHIYNDMSSHLDETAKTGETSKTSEQEEYKKIASTMIKNMETRYGYTEVAAREAFGFLKQKRY